MGDETFFLTVIDYAAHGRCYSYGLQLQFLHTLLAFIGGVIHKGEREIRDEKGRAAETSRGTLPICCDKALL